jgi:hypothetical protein
MILSSRKTASIKSSALTSQSSRPLTSCRPITCTVRSLSSNTTTSSPSLLRVASHARCKSGRAQAPRESVYAAAVTASVDSLGTSPAVVGLNS